MAISHVVQKADGYIEDSFCVEDRINLWLEMISHAANRIAQHRGIEVKTRDDGRK